MKILLIANLYPSEKDKTYGTFVKMFKDGIESSTDEIKFDTCLIKGRQNSVFGKMIVYFVFYLSILYKIFFTNYDLVYNHQITHTAPILRLCRVFKNFPLVMNIHGSDVVTVDRISSVLLKVAIPLLQEADLIVVPSKYFKNEVLKRIHSLDENKFFISPSGGVSKYVFHNDQERIIQKKIVYVSRIDKGKGWDVLLDAVKILKKEKNINLMCEFYGHGEFVNDLLEKIKKDGLSDICIYYGAKTHSELSTIYNNADLLIFPTMLYESLGLVGIESMMCGCPVIGSNIGCLPEFIISGYSGFLFEPGNAIDLSDCIIRYYELEDEEKLMMSKNAIDIAQEYEMKQVSKNMIAKLFEVFR